MKTSFFAAFALLLSFSASAQFVTIQDNVFRDVLISQYPSCFNANNQLDTLCAQNAPDTTLYLNAVQQIQSIEGIEYFSNLKSLYVQSPGLTSLPSKLPNLKSLSLVSCPISNIASLPNSLEMFHTWDVPINSIQTLPNNLQLLWIDYAQITSLPTLPNSLTNLRVLDCNLTSLPALPSGLKALTVAGNQLTTLPALPSGLEGLLVSSNNLNSLPTLPVSLLTLDYNNNDIGNLNSLPPNLVHLTCANTKTTQLPELPNSLKFIDFSHNNITAMPNMPVELEGLVCSKNLLTSLPPFPDSLLDLLADSNLLTQLPPFKNDYCTYISVNANQITSLPSLPMSLTQLNIRDNPLLNCLPLLPPNLLDLHLSGTAISCIPNQPAFLTTSPQLPLCGNGSPCEPAPNLGGQVYVDANANSAYDAGVDTDLSSWIVTNTNNYYSSTSPHGFYVIKLDSGITNTISINPLIPYCSILPATYTVTPTSNGNIGNTYNYQVNFIPNVTDAKVSVAHGPARPGFQQWINVSVNNFGTTAINNATLKLTRPSAFSLINSTPAITFQNMDTLVWTGLNIPMFGNAMYNIKLQIPITAVLGTPYQIHAWIETAATDSTPADNYFIVSDTVVSSFDPNDKQVNKSELKGSALDKEQLIYTIRFQNTGTDTAFNIVIRDTLSNLLDIGSFKMLAASHNYSYVIRENGLLEVFFVNIQLPDSNVNEPLSHGFFQYAIKPKVNLSLGDNIENTAHIYFDYNAPVVTNTTSSVVRPLSLTQHQLLGVQVVPNPAQTYLNVTCAYNNATASICDLSGRVLSSTAFNGKTSLYVGNLAKGLYICNISANGVSEAVKFEVE